jgi:hypothetical protein
MKSYIDYVYYRISKLYYKYDGGIGIYAMLVISLTEGLLVLDIFLFLEQFFFTKQQLQTSKLIGPIIVIVSIFPLSLFNYLRFVRPKGKYDVLNNLWKDESRIKRTIKGLLIFISLLVPWLILFVMNSLNH